MSLYSLVVQGLGALTLVAVLSGLLLLGGLTLPPRRRIVGAAAGWERILLGWAWTVSLLATGGSLYFSEVVGFIPCELCWYQRIAMYPLVLVLGVGILRRDAGAWRFALPLPVLGFLVSVWHVAVQRWPGVAPATCEGEVPCTAIYVAVFGFVTIPVMAGAAFLLIAALLAVVALTGRRGGTERSF